MDTAAVEKKKISVIVPCYNEEKRVYEVYDRLIRIFQTELSAYAFEIIYVDDYSSDNTRLKIEALCKKDQRVKAVFNARNFGFHRNVFQSYQYASGDCAFMMFGDLQDPPEMLPEFVKKWEAGYKCIVGQRERSEEGKLKNGLRKLYYKIINMLSDTKQLELVNGFGLYDRDFLDVLKEIDDTVPFFKAVLNEYGMDICVVKYKHQASKRGKSNFKCYPQGEQHRSDGSPERNNERLCDFPAERPGGKHNQGSDPADRRRSCGDGFVRRVQNPALPFQRVPHPARSARDRFGGGAE